MGSGSAPIGPLYPKFTNQINSLAARRPGRILGLIYTLHERHRGRGAVRRCREIHRRVANGLKQ